MDVPVGHPNFGRIIPCECKIREREAKLLRQYLELSGLEQLEDWTFESFDPTVPGVADAYRIALEYARNPDGWLLLMGGFGCGKTHLAAAIANYVLHHQRLFPLFTVVPDLLDSCVPPSHPTEPTVTTIASSKCAMRACSSSMTSEPSTRHPGRPRSCFRSSITGTTSESRLSSRRTAISTISTSESVLVCATGRFAERFSSALAIIGFGALASPPDHSQAFPRYHRNLHVGYGRDREDS